MTVNTRILRQICGGYMVIKMKSKGYTHEKQHSSETNQTLLNNNLGTATTQKKNSCINSTTTWKFSSPKQWIGVAIDTAATLKYQCPIQQRITHRFWNTLLVNSPNRRKVSQALRNLWNHIGLRVYHMRTSIKSSDSIIYPNPDYRTIVRNAKISQRTMSSQ